MELKLAVTLELVTGRILQPLGIQIIYVRVEVWSDTDRLSISCCWYEVVDELASLVSGPRNSPYGGAPGKWYVFFELSLRGR